MARTKAQKHRKPTALLALNPSVEVAAAVRAYQAQLTVENGGNRVPQHAATLAALTVGLRSLGLLPAQEKE